MRSVGIVPIVVFGAVRSTVNRTSAAVGSALPATSVATTRKRRAPSAGVSVAGEVHGASVASSRAQRNVAPASELNRTGIDVAFVYAGMVESIVVSGAPVSTAKLRVA